MHLPEDEGLVRLGIIAYKCSHCDACQLYCATFEPDGGIMPPNICTVIRGSDGYICGAAMESIQASDVLSMLNRATSPVKVET